MRGRSWISTMPAAGSDGAADSRAIRSARAAMACAEAAGLRPIAPASSRCANQTLTMSEGVMGKPLREA